MVENLQDLILTLHNLRDHPVNYMRPAVLVLAGEVRHRIHVDGLSADGSKIGTYGNKYLQFRMKTHKRDSSTKMIWSLTRQMEQDFVPISQDNLYGLGFNNSHNFDKAMWLENGIKPGTYALSRNETTLAEETITDYLNGIFG